MDPDQLFVVSTVSRKDIAEAVNVTPDDPRLSDRFCERYAKNLYEVECLFESEYLDDAVEELNQAVEEELKG